MRRRFVTLLVEKWIQERHAAALQLHLLEPRCFYGTTREALQALRTLAADADAENKIRSRKLPRAAVSYFRPCSPDGPGDIHFAPMGPGGNDIISMDHEGNTLLYDTCSRAVRAMPKPHSPKLSPVSLAVGDDLYLLNRRPAPQEDHPFEALSLCNGKWCWRSLPPPPFAVDNEHREVEDKEEEGGGCGGGCSRSGENDPYAIAAYTVVGDSQIWISTVGGGTYSFDTTSGAWSKAGDWALPFSGRVEYAPEHGLWFGLSSQDGQFSASDLGAVSATTPPVLQAAWDEIAPGKLPRRWIPVAASLLPLRCGQFCTVRVFDLAPKGSPQEEEGSCQEKKRKEHKNMGSAVVITGVKVDRDSGGDLTMLRHMSKKFYFGGRMAQIC